MHHMKIDFSKIDISADSYAKKSMKMFSMLLDNLHFRSRLEMRDESKVNSMLS